MAQSYAFHKGIEVNVGLAYSKAIAALRALPYQVSHVGELTETIDIGIKTLTILNELLLTGTLLLLATIFLYLTS